MVWHMQRLKRVYCLSIGSLITKASSFGIDQVESIVKRMCKLRGVTYEIMSDAGQYGGVLNEISNPDF